MSNRFVVELIAAGLQVTASCASEARSFAKDDAREFCGEWAYSVGSVRRAGPDEKAAVIPGCTQNEETAGLSELGFEVNQVARSGSLYTFEARCFPVVAAADEADAIRRATGLRA
jgi:hypothetical protein